jgi:MraZ protein
VDERWRFVQFSGSYEHSLDDKGRIILPQTFRNGLRENFVITKGFDNCLFVFTKDYWEKQFESELARMPILDDDAINLQRFFCAEALVDQNTDAQGRIAISSSLREFANIRSKFPIIVLGSVNRVEIWDKEAWKVIRDSLTREVLTRSAANARVSGIAV